MALEKELQAYRRELPNLLRAKGSMPCFTAITWQASGIPTTTPYSPPTKSSGWDLSL